MEFLYGLSFKESVKVQSRCRFGVFRHVPVESSIIQLHKERNLKSLKRCETKDFSIVVMESNCNHIHIMIDYDPKVSILQIVRRLKQISTHDIWLKYDLSKFLWKEKTFWSDGYFACSIGDASEETIRRYIEQQG